MRKISNVSVIGLGALGCAYASRLHDMNPDGLKIIADPERARRYAADGFRINGRRYDFAYVNPEEACTPADLIIVTVKTYQLSQAIRDMRSHVGDNTIILSLLNGITSEEQIAQEYGTDKMLYALSYALTANKEGNSVNFTGLGNITFGEKVNTEYSSKVKAVKELFDRAGIPHTIPENMMRALWWKFMVNVGINQCSAVTRGRYRVFQTVPEAKELMEAAMWEVVRLSEKAGIHLNSDDIARWHQVLSGLTPDSRTSMLEDIESGRRTEVDSFAGTVCELGEKYGVDTPVNRLLLSIIKITESSRGNAGHV